MKASSKGPIKILSYLVDTCDPIAAVCINRYGTLGKIVTVKGKFQTSDYCIIVGVRGRKQMKKITNPQMHSSRGMLLYSEVISIVMRYTVCNREPVLFKWPTILRR